MVGEYDIDTFGQLINDPIRTGAYAEALRRAVRPGSIVLDIGAGTGIFSLLAARFGARRVHAIEPDPVIRTAVEIAAANGLSDRIEFHQALSTDVVLAERADVIVSDISGVLPLHRRRIPALVDARERLLAPGGVMIPARDHVWAAAVSSPESSRRVVEPWLRNPYSLEMKAGRDIAVNQWRRIPLAARDLVSEPVRCATLDFASIQAADLDVSIRLPVCRAGPVHGFGVWFETELFEDIGLSNAPGNPELIYGNAFFHWPEAVEARTGDVVQVRLGARLAGDRYVWSWDSTVDERGDPGRRKAAFRQSTFLGMTLSPSTLERVAADHVPVLGAEGKIVRLVLAEMERGMALGEIASRVQAEFPDRFGGANEALRHVSELSLRYGR